MIDTDNRAALALRPLPRAVLVDLDDTLIDDGSAAVDCWKVACACCPPHADPEVVLAEILRIRDWYWSDRDRHRQGRLDLSAARRHIAGTALANVGCGAADLAQRIGDRYDRCRNERTALFPDALEELRWLRTSGCRLALVTNGAAAAQRQKIARFGLAPLVDAIFVEGELGFGKPDQRVYELAMSELGTAPRDTWMVGDNLEWDVEHPQKLGITGIWIDRAGAGLPAECAVRPDIVIRTLADLRGHCER